MLWRRKPRGAFVFHGGDIDTGGRGCQRGRLGASRFKRRHRPPAQGEHPRPRPRSGEPPGSQPLQDDLLDCLQLRRRLDDRGGTLAHGEVRVLKAMARQGANHRAARRDLA